MVTEVAGQGNPQARIAPSNRQAGQMRLFAIAAGHRSVIRGVAPKMLAPRIERATLPPVRREKSDRHPSERAFVAWLREAARRRGLTQAELAWSMGLRSPTTLQNWFQGIATPSYVHLVSLVAALHELPPELAKHCPELLAIGEAGSGRTSGTSGSDPDPPSRARVAPPVTGSPPAGHTRRNRPRP